MTLDSKIIIIDRMERDFVNIYIYICIYIYVYIKYKHYGKWAF